MHRDSWKLWAAVVLSAGMLELAFPVAGPMPPWRGLLAWVALIPLLWAVLSDANMDRPRATGRSFRLTYLAGILWYIGNCYWVRDTMMQYGDMPFAVPTLLLLGFSLVLGLYFGLLGLALALIRRAAGTLVALAAVPLLWTAIEFAASRITRVPWDQLGYSQVDNALVNRLAPWTGVYGISFLVAAANALAAAALLGRGRVRPAAGAAALAMVLAAALGLRSRPPEPQPAAVAVLVQPNLDVGSADLWPGAEWDRHIAEFARLGGRRCDLFIPGIPETGAGLGLSPCGPGAGPPDLVVWPESPAPFAEQDPRLREALSLVARTTGSPLVVGSIGMEFSPADRQWLDFNSALVVDRDGARIGRYDKIHLVPFGEYVPFQQLLFFARKLTGRVSKFTPGSERKVFALGGRRYGVFICYEAVFADEVRQFARRGAEVLVNISDDGWYGDTSAPWQHLNMARMRAIENRRWLLRATNSGVTAVIDPYGRVRQSIPRHRVDSLGAGFGFRDDVTFYTTHGDVFAQTCAVLALVLVGWAVQGGLRRSSPLRRSAPLRSGDGERSSAAPSLP